MENKKKSVKTEKTSVKTTDANKDILQNCDNLIKDVAKNTDKLRKEYTFEIVRPKIKPKSNRLDTKK